MTNTQFVDDLTSLMELIMAKLPVLAVGLALFALLFWLAKPIARLVIRPLERTSTSVLIQLVLRRTVTLLLILIGFYIFLRLAGLTQFAVALISGTGVLGLIVGFAFKDIAENFLSSLLLSMQRPFKLGDIIEVSGFLGVVKKMTSRATTLVDFNGDHIQIPNATIYKNAIRNLTANPNMRGFFNLGIGYDADADHAQALALNIVRDLDAVLFEPEPQVLIESLGASSLNLKIYFWVNNEKNSKLKVASVLMKRIVNTFIDENISMPDDARERIIIDQSQSERPPKKEAVSDVATHKKGNRDFKEGEDVSSDNDEIRKQAAEARDPEEGENIL
ncbi:mechanosensitive ion channel family protein [Aliiglaciecola sp. M165]|uniref:mechanosensitive ion channel family protein n=1 Tax=Aliiglaciecola sp. M165 TaxID=2593649 RepID=UPI0021B12A17|nr:mechanosensitive ion channel family protein [Aliiglaciecola sp. M165]